MSKIQSAIDRAIANHPIHSKELRKALTRIQWRIVDGNGNAVSTGGNGISRFVPVQFGDVFDGRDNQDRKCKFFSVCLGVTVYPELICAS